MAQGLAVRRLTPELLDQLPPDDPAAMASRRDLVRVNALMFQPAIMAGLIRRHVPANRPLRLLEVGSGDGNFIASVAHRLGKNFGDVTLTMLDMAPIIGAVPLDRLARCGWQVTPVTADVFEWSVLADIGPFDAVCANLFLHHFEGEQLTNLLAALCRLAPLVLATEPRRNAFSLLSSRLLGFVGCNHVTRHDAKVSVEAGFAGDDFARLWPLPSWTVTETRAGPFTHALVARSEAAR